MYESLPPWLQFFCATPVATIINGIIVALTLTAFANLLVAFRRLSREDVALSLLRGKAAGGDELLQSLADAEDLKGSLVEFRIRLLTGPTAVIAPWENEVVSAADAEELHQQVSFARSVAAAVVLLGLAGTLVGLSLGLAPLARVLGQTTPALGELWPAMQQSVRGLRTALSTTLAGVAGALALSLALHAYGRRQGQFLTRMERVFLEAVLPAFTAGETARLQHVVSALEDAGESIKTGFSGLLTRVEQQGHALSSRMVEGFEEATGEMVQGFRALIRPFEELRDATLRLIGESSKDAEPLSMQAARLEQASSVLEESVEATRQLIPDLRKALIETVHEQSELTRTTLDRSYQEMAARIREQSESTSQLTTEIRGTVEAIGQLAEDLSSFASSAEEYQGVWEAVAHTVSDAERTLDSRLAGISRTVAEGSNKLFTQQADVQQRVLGALAQFEAELRDAIESIERERRRAVSRSEELIRELREAVKDALREIDARGRERESEVGKSLKHAFAELQLELRDLAFSRQGTMVSHGDGSQAESALQTRAHKRPGGAVEHHASRSGRQDLGSLFESQGNSSQDDDSDSVGRSSSTDDQ